MRSDGPRKFQYLALWADRRGDDGACNRAELHNEGSIYVGNVFGEIGSIEIASGEAPRGSFGDIAKDQSRLRALSYPRAPLVYPIIL